MTPILRASLITAALLFTAAPVLADHVPPQPQGEVAGWRADHRQGRNLVVQYGDQAQPEHGAVLSGRDESRRDDARRGDLLLLDDQQSRVADDPRPDACPAAALV